jgi:hypothetical protein
MFTSTAPRCRERRGVEHPAGLVSELRAQDDIVVRGEQSVKLPCREDEVNAVDVRTDSYNF